MVFELLCKHQLAIKKFQSYLTEVLPFKGSTMSLTAEALLPKRQAGLEYQLTHLARLYPVAHHFH